MEHFKYLSSVKYFLDEEKKKEYIYPFSYDFVILSQM